jgi:RNA polymerase sporulation-specific sigma factor
VVLLLKYHELTVLSDDVLCNLVSRGERDAEEILVLRYFGLVRICARPYYLAGGSYEDVTQEGLLGLLNAVREFSPDKKVPFKNFAENCIKKRIYSGLRAASRNKHMPLNSYLPIDSLFDDGASASDLVCNRGDTNPEELILSRERYEELFSELKGLLSELESKILEYYLDGLTVREISALTGRTPKSVDNAVWRVRRKLASHLKRNVGR